MSLKSIQFYTDQITDVEHNFRAAAVVNLFLKKLRPRDKTKGVGYINIYLMNDKGLSKISAQEGAFLDYHIYFDMEKYIRMDSYQKKMKILDTMLDVLITCSNEQGWTVDAFLDAYNDCLKDGLKNEWWFKNKLFNSPDGKVKAGLFNCYELDGYRVYIVVHDGKNNELGRRIVFQDTGLDFPIEWASWQESNDSFYFKFKPSQKIFQVKVEDVIKGKAFSLPEKTSDYFKK